MKTENKLPIPTITLTNAIGNRFYKGRRVLSISVDFPLIESRWIDKLSMVTFNKLLTLLRSNSRKEKTKPVGTGRNSTLKAGSSLVFSFTPPQADTVLKVLFGYTAMQAYFRLLKQRKLWARDRGRPGKWLLSKKVIELHYMPRDSWSRATETFTKIPKEYLWLFLGMIEDYDNLNKYSTTKRMVDCPWDATEVEVEDIFFKYDYSAYDTGEERKPYVYECNLCGSKGIPDNWVWDSFMGEGNNYIKKCINCEGKQVKRLGGMLTEETSSASGFNPFGYWQDDYYFNL